MIPDSRNLNLTHSIQGLDGTDGSQSGQVKRYGQSLSLWAVRFQIPLDPTRCTRCPQSGQTIECGISNFPGTACIRHKFDAIVALKSHN